MHELSICQSIVRQGIEIADANHARSIISISLTIGPLAGIDIQLLKTAFPMATMGTPAECATLDIQSIPLQIHCNECHINAEAQINNLACPQCGNNRTRLINGDEMLITHIEITSDQEAVHV